MNRNVRQTDTLPGKSNDASLRPFSDFVDQSNLIVLGDPGAGKTHLFKEAALAEGARFLSARTFLTVPAYILSGQVLYIDGLDEKRAGRGDCDTIDTMVQKLFAVAPPKVRLSCRAADWLGESDLTALNPYFERSGAAIVLLLQSLTPSEQRAVLAEQGVNSDTAIEFLKEAVRRGLDDFLENPQNLIMLWDSVQTGRWPATRTELFKLSTTILLKEANSEHARCGAGIYSAAELQPVAGAICAARLISDVDAISLTNQEGGPNIPGYRSVTIFKPELVEAALGRRVFDAGSEPETVDYTHRTTAEFLAAAFLATRIRNGLPFGRITALMGIDGHPAPELRGLHAWLAVHLPEYANQLIAADPYGVLTYGDAGALPPSSCECLVRELDRLSEINPWFRSGNGTAAIGALARADMVQIFRILLNNPNSSAGIRSIVVEALSLGVPIPAMLPDLANILSRQESPLAERLHALDALLRLGDDGREAAGGMYAMILGRSKNDLRVRAEIVHRLYGESFEATAVTSLVNDILEANETAFDGILWELSDRIPVPDLPEILDSINSPVDDVDEINWGSREVGSFYTKILIRAWSASSSHTPNRVLSWLCKRARFKNSRSESLAQGLRAEMRKAPDKLYAIADYFFVQFQ